MSLLGHITAEIVGLSMQRHELQLLMHAAHPRDVHMIVQRPGWATVCLLAVVVMCTASLEWWHCWDLLWTHTDQCSLLPQDY